MNNSEWLSFPCIEFHQPIGTAYIGSIDSAQLTRISWADVRRLSDREVEEMTGIQRPLNPKRVVELKKYVRNIDAAFPTGIILAMSSEDAKFDSKAGMMRVKNADNVAKILDGQHRIAGLQEYSGSLFQLNVTIYIDMDIEDQAQIFATINLTQTKVSKSLMYDLFDFAETRSPQKTCHNAAKVLNRESKSPFFKRIKILGVASGGPNETLTQAAFIDPLLPYVSKDPPTDRDRLKRGKSLELAEPGLIRVQRLIFRNMFIQDKDEEIVECIWNYFDAVAKRWPRAWNSNEPGIILSRTTGFRALARFLPDVYLSFGKLDNVISEPEFLTVFNRIRINDGDFNSDEFKPGTSGQAELYRRLSLQARLA